MGPGSGTAQKNGPTIKKSSPDMSFASYRSIPVMILLLGVFCPCCHDPGTRERPEVNWQPFQPIEQEGLLGERLDGWRMNRLWYMADTSWLLSGFESCPGSHAWQGEHIGKWLHAAVLAHQATRDGAEDQGWTAFSYGPMALSQEITADTKIIEPFRDRIINPDDIPEMLEMPREPGTGKTEVSFMIAGTDITLIPYYLAGSRISGPRTYFEIRSGNRTTH
jgi:hypothetical protein